ncbi:CurL C-terminal domain-containing protein, partial [Nocardia gipuzkoensis]
EPPVAAAVAVEPGAVRLLPISARTATALRGQAERLAAALRDRPELEPAAVARTLALHRTHFEWRAAIVADRREELLSGLAALAAGADDADVVLAARPALPPGRIAFVCPGQGAQWDGMARDLLATSPVFRTEFERCDAVVRSLAGWSPAAVLTGDADAPGLDRDDV